ncbi:LytR family transcriptional regulator [Deinococcus sp. Arct2-2]|nr:LytR family transcriptional regulator [Deinococcus sp. Arct2-2]
MALCSPAVPALVQYGALPRPADAPVTVLLAGVTPRYPPSAVWPYPAAPEEYDYITDTLILAQMRPDGTTHLLSLPRDTWLNIPQWGFGKINGANSHGGPSLLVGAVERLTGLKVDAYALLSLHAVRSMTDAAGGVTLDVPKRMKYDDTAGNLHIDLQPGRQHLNGQQAEGFLRFRNDGLGDIGRVARQQTFLTAFVSTLKHPVNVWRWPALVGALNSNVKSNLSRAQVGALLGGALQGPTVALHTLPGTPGGGGTWIANDQGVRALITEHFRDPRDPRAQTIAVINVAAPNGSARRLKAKLEGLGYQDVRISSALGEAATTTVSGAAAAWVRRDMDMGYGQIDAGPDLSGAAVTVRLGSDTPAGDD